MKVIFLGVGEAFDELLPNNSHLVLSDSVVLLDCGYSVPPQLWRYTPDQSFLDAVYISHSHADHYFGLPALLLRMWEGKRRKPLTIICQQGLRETILGLIDAGYRGFPGRLEFPLHFLEIDEGRTVRFNEFEVTLAPTIHSSRNCAIGLSDGLHSVCYSGDGMFSDGTERLYRNADLMIHEAYTFDQRIMNHACMTDLIEMADRNNVKCIAMTHLQRDLRRGSLEALRQKAAAQARSTKVIIPDPLEEMTL